MQGKLRNFKTNSQCDRILKYLKAGNSLTVEKARELKLGSNLRSRISDLKDAGYNIISTKIKFMGGYIAEYKMSIDTIK